MRRHWFRDAARGLVLLGCDLGVFLLLRAVVRGIRDGGSLGEPAAALMQLLIPAGSMAGWQMVSALILGLMLSGAYGAGPRRRETGRLYAGAGLAALFILYQELWAGSPLAVSVRALAFTVAFGGGLALARSILDRTLRRVLPVVAPIPTVVVSGGAREWLGANPSVGARVGRSRLLVVATVRAGNESEGVPLHELGHVIDQRGAESVLVSGHLSDADFAFVVDTALVHGCQLLAASRTERIASVEPRPTWQGDLWLVELTAPGLRASELVIKRVTDVVLSGIGLLLLAPLFAVVGALVMLDSPGPVFYGSERWGQAGRRIRIWKFRTMVDGAADLLQQDAALRAAYLNEVKLRTDPRVTRLGRWLRRWSLDELPQLFNVFVGDMSLVGPRPKLIGEEERYSGGFAVVLAAPPGLTGLWQISGRNSLSYDERVSLDLKYVREWSFAGDLAILLRTIPVVLRGTGAH